jgi:hypothetical protein
MTTAIDAPGLAKLSSGDLAKELSAADNHGPLFNSIGQ